MSANGPTAIEGERRSSLSRLSVHPILYHKASVIREYPKAGVRNTEKLVFLPLALATSVTFLF